MMDFLNNRHNTDGNYVFVAHISIFLPIFLPSHSSVSPHWAIFHLEYSNYFLGFSLFTIPLKKKKIASFLDCRVLQMPMRSGRRRGASEERRGRRPHPSPTRPERSDRQTVRAFPFLCRSQIKANPSEIRTLCFSVCSVCMSH